MLIEDIRNNVHPKTWGLTDLERFMETCSVFGIKEKQIRW